MSNEKFYSIGRELIWNIDNEWCAYDNENKWVQLYSGNKININEPWNTLLDQSQAPISKWFVGGKTNASFNELDQHLINGNGNQTAFIHESVLFVVFC